MTTKRFTYDKPVVAFSKGGINDNVTGETYEFTMDTVLDLLNELHEEAENLKDVNTQCCNDYSAMRRDVLRYKEENEQLKATIKEAYQSERTMIGQSVLKQLIDKME